MKYRKDIQILRGISVLLVVFFHLEVGGFNSGFLGVDVFFVISGYLMAVLYNPDQKREFFVKRARRLLPAYFAVVLATLIACMIRSTPNDYGSVVKQVAFATFFASNIGYWMENSYFSKAAFNPLLHLWSLGVEIQFYILLPLFYWLFAKLRGSYFVVLIGSLLACFYMVGISPKTSFFMVPFRLWEFLLGYGIAQLVFRGIVGKHEPVRWLGAAGLVLLICIPMIKVDGQATNFMQGHPGISALSVCLATALILAVGLPAVVENTRVAGWLEKLGDYSYSIYLVHFPLIVLSLYKPFSGTILHAEQPWQTPVLAIAIVLLSWLMYRFVEKPFRKKTDILGAMALCGLSALVLAPLGAQLQKYLIPEREMKIYQAWTDRAEYRCGKLKRIFDPLALSCEISKPLTDPKHRILLVGNSHADSIKTTFKSVAEAHNNSVRFMVDNAPLMTQEFPPETIIAEAKKRQSDALVLHFSPKAIPVATIAKVAELAAAKHIKTAFILPAPAWPEHIPMALWNNLKLDKPLPKAVFNDYLSANKELIEGLAKLEETGMKIYPVAENFCTPECKLTDPEGKPLYFDTWHLTLTGSDYLRGVFEKIMADIEQNRTVIAN